MFNYLLWRLVSDGVRCVLICAGFVEIICVVPCTSTSRNLGEVTVSVIVLSVSTEKDYSVR